MSINELNAKVRELRELRDLEAELKAEIASIEDNIKAEMLAKNTEVLEGHDWKITWKTVSSSRFDSASFKLCYESLFQQFSRVTTSRRFVLA